MLGAMIQRRSVSFLAILGAAAVLAGCAQPTQPERHLTERGRNVAACETLDQFFDEFDQSFDEGTIDTSDMDKVVTAYLDAQRQVWEAADTPLGVEQLAQLDASEDQWFGAASGDREAQEGFEETEQLGSDVNNGKDVAAAEGSLVERCGNLGVDMMD